MTHTFELAQPEDDAVLRQLLANNAMPRHIRISYQREPNCRTHQPTRELTGLACRATRPLFVNGKEQEMGY